MLNVGKFFSNSLIVIGGRECEIITSPSGSRLDDEDIFTVPIHTVGTNNLLIFVDGKVLIPNIHYKDINSYQIQLTKPIGTNVDFHSILINLDQDSDSKDDLVWQDF